MKFKSLQPFVPSGEDFESAKQFFLELGFNLTWENVGYCGFQKDECRFILQHYNNRDFAENFMLTVNVDDVAEFRRMVLEKQLPAKFPIRIGDISMQPYGKEVNIIDAAGVCWHFVEQ